MRPIDADTLVASLEKSYRGLRELHDQIKEDEGAKEVYQGELITFLEAILRAKNAPTLDYAPVVHGSWIPVWYDLFKIGYVKCSVCGHKEKQGGWAYCHCGAKMDVGKENGT